MKKTAFTLIEILVCVAICSMIGTLGLTFMSRGASNVARGSFNTIAANQASLIIFYLRSDISRSKLGQITDASNGWTGDGEFVVTYNNNNNKAIYTYDAGTKTLSREAPNNAGYESTQSLGTRYLSEFKITKMPEDEHGRVGYKVEIVMSESEESNFVPLSWSSVIFPPQPSNNDIMSKSWQSLQ